MSHCFVLRSLKFVAAWCLAIVLYAVAFAPSVYAAEGSYDKSYVGEMQRYTTKYEDTFVDLARKHDLGFVELRAANPFVDPWMPGEGVELILPARHLFPDAPKDGIVINLPEMRLYAFVHGDKPPTTHAIGVGRVGLETPLGTTKVRAKAIGPSWRPTQRMRSEDPSLPAVIKPGADNPLGTHALYLDWPAYAIHGTNRPFGIGRRVSSGCIRVYPEKIVTLFDKIDVGTKVTVVNQPVKAGWIGDQLYLEVNPTLDQSSRVEEEGGYSDYLLSEKDMAILLKAAGDKKANINWQRVRDVVRKREGYPIVIASRENG